MTNNIFIEQSRNEETTKLQFITPEITKKWTDLSKIIMEYYFTAGRIAIDEYNIAHRGKPYKADYLLLIKNNVPLAIVEAKGMNCSADDGYQQAIEYARILDVPFAYSSNGIDLIEKDMISGINKQMKLKDNFPGPDELWDRYIKENGFTEDVENIFSFPYYETPDGKKPRYYQRIAINRTIEAVAKGNNRILLTLATGTGKTYLAFQIIYRFWKTKAKKKILFLADRNILIDQTMKNDFRPFEKSMVRLEGRNIDFAHEIYMSLYHQLKNGDIEHYKQFPRDFFDLIVIDECHRGSANEDSSWHDILNYFSSATQIGLTATPKYSDNEAKSNYTYFGEPIYTYSLKQGIEDGFLAPYKVMSVMLDIDEKGYTPPEGTTDVEGNPIKIQTYYQEDFDRKIVVAERREIVAQRITDYMKTNNRYAKTILFCEDIPHCQEMKRLLENENADLVAEDSRYIMQITGDEDFGKAQLENFIEPTSRYPVIAITSRLMSTGVDAQTCENIILDKCIGSMTEFKQIIGRGTRIKESYEIEGEEHTKMYFSIIDFRKNYLKFTDPDFDGDPSDVTTVPSNKPFPKPPIKPEKPVDPVIPPENRRIARVSGVDVEIVGETVQYLDKNGNLITQNLASCIKNNILSQYDSIDDFKKAWILNKNKKQFASELLLEIDWEENYKKRYNYTVDNYDIILNYGFDIEPPVSKRHRTQNGLISRYLNSLSVEQQQLVLLLLEVYVEKNFEVLKDLNIFDLPQFVEKGLTKLKSVKLFGSKEKYYKFLSELENKLYE